MFDATRNVRFAVGVALVVAWQLVQGWRWSASEFEKSYWLVTYEHGFVRRGLGGELLRWWPGPTTAEMVLYAALSTSLLSAAMLVWVVGHLVARGDAPARWLALLVAASPFTLEVALNKHRPDQFGLVVLVALALAGHRRLVAVAASIGLAALVFVHEGALVSYGVFAVPLLVRAGTRSEWLRAAAFLAPAAVATGVVLGWGRAAPAQVDALLHDPDTVALLQRPADTDYSVLPYLGDTVDDSLRFVLSMPNDKMVQMALWAAALGALHAVWVLVAGIRIPGTARAWFLPLAGFVFIHLTGIDWMRWTASAWTSMLVVAAGLLPARAATGATRPPRWPWWLLAAYLAARPPAGSVGWRTGWVGFGEYWLWPLPS